MINTAYNGVQLNRSKVCEGYLTISKRSQEDDKKKRP